jgi:hypothetical protein
MDSDIAIVTKLSLIAGNLRVIRPVEIEKPPSASDA